MPKLPDLKPRQVIAALEKAGFRRVRQKGSHVRLRKKTASGVHHLTVPAHPTIAKGTLSDILSAVSTHNAVPKEALLKQLREG